MWNASPTPGPFCFPDALSYLRFLNVGCRTSALTGERGNPRADIPDSSHVLNGGATKTPKMITSKSETPNRETPKRKTLKCRYQCRATYIDNCLIGISSFGCKRRLLKLYFIEELTR